MLPLAVYRIFSIEMINPNPSPTWRTAFGLSSIGVSGQNRFSAEVIVTEWLQRSHIIGLRDALRN